LVEIAEEADKEIRDSISGLRVALGPEGFFAALARYLDRYERTHGIEAELVKPATLSEEVFDSRVKVQLLSIIQEALTNVRKHSGARCVWVIFEPKGSTAQVVIQDDGRGFDARRERIPPERVGLRGMRERAKSVGGSLVVASTPGAGTQIVVTVPTDGGSGPYPGG
jgi:signal transduction histidine kinase